MISKYRNLRILRLSLAFAAGFISVPLFHQGMLAFLNQIDFTQFAPYPTDPTQPFGIAAIWSMSFWGGVWGIVLGAIAFRLGNRSYWLTALLFGAFAPTSVFLFLVLPLKGMPVAGGWQLSLIATGILVNAAWGLGTVLILRSIALAVNSSR